MHKIFVLLLSLSVLISCSRGQSCEVRGYIIDYDDVYSYFITKYNNIESEYPGFRVENNYLFFESSFLFDNNFSLETNSENSTKYICNYKLKMNSLSGTFQLNAIDNEYIFEIGLNFFWYTTTKETKKIFFLVQKPV